MNIKFIKLLVHILAIFTIISSLSFADTDGVWHYAKDIRPGTFGSDETTLGDYTFEDNVLIDNAVLNISTNTGRGIFVKSSVNDGIGAFSNSPGSSAVYGWAQGGANSGYFEGGNFIVGSHRVGIGTITPTGDLDIYRASTNSNLYVRRGLVSAKVGSDSTSTNFGSSSNHNLNLLTNNLNRLTITNTGNVGIGTTNPAHTLDIVGDLRTTSGIHTRSIEPLSDSLMFIGSGGYETSILSLNTVTTGVLKTQGGLVIETRDNNPPTPEIGRMWLRTDI